MHKTSALLVLLCFHHLIFSQNYILSGKISGNHTPLPFATVLVKGSTVGTNSNPDGHYALKLPAGTYEIVYQYMGYSKKTELVHLIADRTLDADLATDGISLREVEVNAGEDPAYPIIRKAIKKRRFYLDQLDAYSCEAYIKGLQKIITVPKNIKGLIRLAGGQLSDTSDIRGVLYLSESKSKYYFQKPGDEKEIMYSSKVSGNKQSFSFNQLSDMKLNFYKDLVELPNLTSRPFISPINDNAFFFYRYYLLGTIRGEGKIINKIKVVPRHKTDPCFSGVIYIQDSTWRITSLDLTITKDTKISFVDTLHLRQLHAPVLGDSIWMPVTLNFAFDFSAFGFAGKGYFNANINTYALNPPLPKKFFKNEVLKVEEGSNKKDSAYWEANRAVPLTLEESRDYHEKDSISNVRGTLRYQDSADHVSNRLAARHFLLGYTYQNTRRKLEVVLPGLITNGVQYNTVEGLNLSYKLNVDKSYDDFRHYSLNGKARYGFSNRLWGGALGFNYLFRPEHFSGFGIQLRSLVEQYNHEEPISQLVNTAYSLLANDNYMKLYKESGMGVHYYSELLNGIYFAASLQYMQRDPLKNTSDVLLIDDPHKLFTSDDPLHPRTDALLFGSNRALATDLSLSFHFRQKYYSLPHRKVIENNVYPILTLSYKKAIPALNATADYDLVAARLSDDIKMGLLGRFFYSLKAGAFLNTKKIYFMDYSHFSGNQTFIQSGDYLNSFRLLPYYTFSSNRWFAEAHAEHHFKGFIINRIPGIRKLKVRELLGAHFLTNNTLRYYYELNFGLERIFNVIRMDYVVGYAPNSRFRQGFTVGLKLPF